MADAVGVGHRSLGIGGDGGGEFGAIGFAARDHGSDQRRGVRDVPPLVVEDALQRAADIGFRSRCLGGADVEAEEDEVAQLGDVRVAEEPVDVAAEPGKERVVVGVEVGEAVRLGRCQMAGERLEHIAMSLLVARVRGHRAAQHGVGTPVGDEGDGRGADPLGRRVAVELGGEHRRPRELRGDQRRPGGAPVGCGRQRVRQAVTIDRTGAPRQLGAIEPRRDRVVDPIGRGERL